MQLQQIPQSSQEGIALQCPTLKQKATKVTSYMDKSLDVVPKGREKNLNKALYFGLGQFQDRNSAVGP